jgi:hypothetical protein
MPTGLGSPLSFFKNPWLEKVPFLKWKLLATKILSLGLEKE